MFAQLEAGRRHRRAQLADYYNLPAPYLAKQLQGLVRTGVLAATTWPRGGFRLARPPSEITLPEAAPTRTRSRLARG